MLSTVHASGVPIGHPSRSACLRALMLAEACRSSRGLRRLQHRCVIAVRVSAPPPPTFEVEAAADSLAAMATAVCRGLSPLLAVVEEVLTMPYMVGETH